MLMRRLVLACVASLLLRSWDVSAETSQAASPEKTWQSLSSHRTSLKSLFPNLQGVAVDRESGAAVLTIFALVTRSANTLAKRSAAEKLLDVPVRIDVIGALLKQQ